MKQLLIIASLSFLSLTAIAGDKCKETTQEKKQCNRSAIVNGYCYQHNPNRATCNGTTKAGNKCKLSPKKGTKYCHLHTK